VVADALRLPLADASFDVATVAFGLRNMVSWTDALAEMRRILRPGGHLLILDFALPSAPLRWIYRPYLRYVLPRVAGWLTGDKGAYDYLGESIEQFPSGAAMCAMIDGAGFTDTQHEPLTGGIVAMYTATSRPDMSGRTEG
jgi:demethylmenaquinone methyltransferase/2-methoxy-6-polyprenyl-1,4-benzoquinol methylase